MSNPWADIYDDLRSPYLQEKKAKKDYDGDGKVESGKDEYFGSKDKAIKAAIAAKKGGVKKEGYMSKDKEDHDTGGFRISNKEAKAAKERLKKKQMKKEEYGCSSDSPIKVTKKKKKKVEEKYDNTKSPDYAKKKKALAKKHGGNIKGHPQYEQHGIDIEHIDGSVTEITDVIKAPKMVAAPKLSNWREDFVWDEPVDEALKQPKLDIKEKGVKNKVEINPTVATEGYMSKDKEGHTTGGFRISDKEAKKAKERLKKKYKKEDVENLPEMDGTKAALAGVTTIVGGGLELVRRAKNAAERIRQKRTDAMNKALGTEEYTIEGKKKGLDGKACWKGYKLAGTKKKGGKTVDNCVKEEEKKKLTERDVYIKSWNRNPLSGLPDYKQDKKRKIKTANPMPVDKASYEPEGDVLSDGYQRNPERDTRSARQRRMDSPDRGINSPAFRAFMAAQQKPSKPKKKKDVKEGIVTELNRYEKETGKSSGSMNMPKGKPTSKGGTSSPVMRAVRTKIRKETGKPTGQTSKKKGEKGNRQPGDRKTTPADSIAKRRESRADAEKLMRDTRGT